MTGTVTQTTGSTFNSEPDPFNYTMATVVKGSPDRIGPAQGVGLGGNQTLVSTTGIADFNPDGVLTHTVNGTWISPDSRGTLTNVTLDQTPGTYFQQTTTGGGTANISPPTTVAPYTQDTTLFADMTRTGVAPATNLGLNGTITSTISNPGAFPAPGPVPTVVTIQGVVAPGGIVQSGNMTMTTYQGPGAPVSTFTSPVSIDTTTSILTASNLVGGNVANPGVNRVPARQTGAVTDGQQGGTVIAAPLRR